jgi:hypothetical protein
LTGYLTFLFIATAAVMLPLISAAVWFLIFSFILPGFPLVVRKLLFIGNAGKWKQDVAVSFTQLMFHLSMMVSLPASAVLELIVLIPLALLMGVESGVTQTLVVASAGPIEETMKFASALVIFIIIFLTHGRLKGDYNPIKVGIISGIFAGTVFGLVESIGYLSIALEELVLNGPTLQYMDAFVWRVLLGVSIHASYTGLASGGMGRRTWSERVRITSILLGIAIVYHTLNNGVQGFIFLILEMDDASGYLIVDVFQGFLAVSNLILLSLVWRGKIFKSNDSPYYHNKMYKSKTIYSTHRN